jgi:acetylglutamate kinase
VNRLTIVKIGGEVIDAPRQLSKCLQSFVAISGKKILVHGGGKTASQMSVRLGLTPKFAQGRRITDAETLMVVQMVYAGLLNKNIVAELQMSGCNALGMTGADANMILAEKRAVKDVDYGFAGDIKEINSAMLLKILKAGLVPVFCPLTHDGRNQFLNTNADTIAARMGSALADSYAVEVIFCFGKKGVLENEADGNSVIAGITKKSYQLLLQKGIIKDGMIPKLDNAFQALSNGVKKIYIIHADALEKLNQKIAGGTSGTVLTLD